MQKKTSKASPIQLSTSSHKKYSIIYRCIYIYQTQIFRWWLFVLFTIKLPPKIILRFRRFQKTPKVHGGPYIDATGLWPWHLANGPCQQARWSAGRGTLEEKIVAYLEDQSAETDISPWNLIVGIRHLFMWYVPVSFRRGYLIFTISNPKDTSMS